MNTLANNHEHGGNRSCSAVRRWALGLCVPLLCFLLWPHAASAADKPEHEIKLATLAPESTSLMQIFREMDGELRKETGGRVGFKIFAGFVLGDEVDVLRKLRIGLVHAATFTHTTLTSVNTDIRVLQIPFLFRNYQEVDYLLEKMSSDFERGFAKRGYEILGWSELGFIYIMATAPIATVADMKGKKVWTRADSPMANAVFSRAGVSPVTLNAPDVLVALQTHLLEVVYNSPYYALVTQWYSRIKYITDVPLAYIGGLLIIDRKVFLRLSPQDREILKAVCSKHMRRLTEKTRRDNEEALSIILRRGVKRITPEPREVEHFKELLEQAMSGIDPKYLPRDLRRKVEDEIGAYRARMGGGS